MNRIDAAANRAVRSRDELTGHLAKCKMPGQCVECEILLTMFGHWSQNLGVALMQSETGRRRWRRRH